MLRIRWPVFVALALALLAPTPALADEVNPVEGFTGGISDLFSGEAREPVEDPVRDYEYEPVLREVDEQPELEEGTTISHIDGVVQSASRVQWGNNAGTYTPLAFLQTYFNYVGRQNSQFLILAVGLVFMWWGVRKAIRMVMSAWRRGRATA